MFPIYAQIKNENLSERLDKIKALLREIESQTAFLSTMPPMLVAAPAPDNDYICVGNVIVCGTSTLSSAQRQELIDLLASFG
ncbi:MAG: hypothetical protein IJX39_04860 [Clostridia bacterium]|nr:hypothetical protein [Clostridia bacterium]